MKNFAAIARFLILVASLATAGCTDKRVELANQSISTAKTAIERRLTDPSSVQYRGIGSFSEDVVCGEVNAKNKMGGYVGFKPFIYNGEELGQVQLSAVPSQTDLWCSNDPQKRSTSLSRQSDKGWISLVVREQGCSEAQDRVEKTIACDMAESARHKLKVRPSVEIAVAAEKATVDAETRCAGAAFNSPEERMWCQVAAKGRDAIARAKQE